MGWLQDEQAKWAKIAEATKDLLDMPESDLTMPENKECETLNIDEDEN